MVPRREYVYEWDVPRYARVPKNIPSTKVHIYTVVDNISARSPECGGFKAIHVVQAVAHMSTSLDCWIIDAIYSSRLAVPCGQHEGVMSKGLVVYS